MGMSTFLSISTLLGLATLVESKEPVPRTTVEQSRAAGKVGEFVLKSAVELIEGFGELVRSKPKAELTFGVALGFGPSKSSNNEDDPTVRIRQSAAESDAPKSKTPVNAVYNISKLDIPISYDPARKDKIGKLLLYVSRDEGKSWKQYAVATPKDSFFAFNAPEDGIYWFQMVIQETNGLRDPVDLSNEKYAPLKLLIDTKSPVVAIKSVDRVGDAVRIAWDIREENPDWSRFQADYCVDDGAWIPIEVTKKKLVGSAQFRVAQTGLLTVRIRAYDLAGNSSEMTKQLDEADDSKKAIGIVLEIESQWNRFAQWINDDDPNERVKQLLAESDDLRKANDERHRLWLQSQPLILPYDPRTGQMGEITPTEKKPVDALMTLEDIVALATGGISDDLILNQMRTTGTTFALGTKEILFLKKNEVSDRVVTEMQNSRGRHKASNNAVGSKMP